MSKYSIKRAAVIGAGTMGSQIAATIANTDIPVLLLDLVPKGANDRDTLAKNAIEKLKQGKSLFSASKATNIQPGNMEDDLDKLEKVDWVIECVPEDQKIKLETYKKVGAHTDAHTLISSNTSTIPLNELKEGLDDGLQHRLCITHFFNPPSVMPLLELVADQDNEPQAIQAFKEFADRDLGKNVIRAKDTPGFIANRIGMFWLLCAMEEAEKEGISIETADAVMNGAFGFPKTGIFALADLIGLKLIPEIAKSMRKLLPEDDAFCQLEGGLKLVQARINAADKGTKAGFYRKTDDGKKQVLDLKTHEYRDIKKAKIEIEHWHDFLSGNKPESLFAVQVMTKLLGYASEVAPQIADNILDVDAAMRDGFGWKQGPFEMIDRIGASWLVNQMMPNRVHPSSLLQQAAAKGFYPKQGTYLSFDGNYRKRKIEKDKWTLALKTAGKKPIIESETAKLWDIGNNVACFEMTAKMGTIGWSTLDTLTQAVEKAESEFIGLVIGHDGKHFSAGLNLHIIAESAQRNDWKGVEALIKQGQESMLRIKQSRVPVVAAIFGYTLGGACEMTMHCAAAQAHALVHLGLVEINIGVIPAWGGTKEHLWDAIRHGGDDADSICNHALRGFREVAAAKRSANAEQAFDMELLHDPSRITANRERLLPDAKALVLRIAKYYQPRNEDIMEVPSEALHERFVIEVENICERQPNMDMHRKKALHKLAEAASGFAAVKSMERQVKTRKGWNKISEREMLDSIRTIFMELVQTKEALEKIQNVIKK